MRKITKPTATVHISGIQVKSETVLQSGVCCLPSRLNHEQGELYILGRQVPERCEDIV